MDEEDEADEERWLVEGEDELELGDAENEEEEEEQEGGGGPSGGDKASAEKFGRSASFWDNDDDSGLFQYIK